MHAVVFVWRSVLLMTGVVVFAGLSLYLPFPLALLGSYLTWATIVNNFEEVVAETIGMHFEEDEDDGTIP